MITLCTGVVKKAAARLYELALMVRFGITEPRYRNPVINCSKSLSFSRKQKRQYDLHGEEGSVAELGSVN